MFGPQSGEPPAEICYGNCPRVFPVAGGDLDEVEKNEEAAREAIPDEYDTEIGRKIYAIRYEPCYIMVKLTRPHCRSLRNYIISNSSRLEVIDGTYCGIATKVFNISNHTMENNSSIGLLKFKTMDNAFRFVMSETKMSRQEFLGGAFDIWNLPLCSEDRSVVPNPSNPDKMVNSVNVFHFVHVKKIASIPDTTEDLSAEAQQRAMKAAEEERKAVDEAIRLVSKHEGRLVVATDKMQRIRGLPLTNAEGEPRKFVYLTQWPGMHYFWKWHDDQDGKRFLSAIKEYTGGDYQSLLFTCCLDFHDLV